MSLCATNPIEVLAELSYRDSMNSNRILSKGGFCFWVFDFVDSTIGLPSHCRHGQGDGSQAAAAATMDFVVVVVIATSITGAAAL